MFNQLKIIGYVLLLFQLPLGYSFWNGNTMFAQEFKVQLDRPDYLKSNCQVSYRATRVIRVFTPNQSSDLLQSYNLDSSTKYVIELQGRIHFERAPDSSQRSIRVTQFHTNDELTADGFNLDLKNKTLLIQETNGKRTFQVNGSKIEGFDAEIIELLFSADWWGREGTDKIFGSPQTKVVGDSWTFQPSVTSMKKLLPSEIYKEKGVNSKFNCAGKAKLAGKTTIAGRDYYQLNLSEKCPDCLAGKTPDGLKIVGCLLERTITGNLPVDSDLPWQKVNIKSRQAATTQFLEHPLKGVKQQSSIIEDVTKEFTFPEK